MIGPQALLEEYKQYEFVLNVDYHELCESLFNVPGMLYDKKDLDAIREQIERFYNAEEEILNISNNYNDYPMFRVKAEKLKKQLAGLAAKIKRKIIDKCYEWCNSSVNKIEKTYLDMERTIKTAPTDEKALVEIKEFIDVSKKKTKKELEDLWLTVYKHMNMLDDFSEFVEKNDKGEQIDSNKFMF